MVYSTIAAVEWWNGGVLGRIGSGERRSLPDSTQAPFFFRSALSFAPFTVHFVLLTERLKQAILSVNKLSKKAVMQNTKDYNIYFLRVSCGATYYERGIERQNECNHLSYT